MLSNDFYEHFSDFSDIPTLGPVIWARALVILKNYFLTRVF